MENGKRQSGIPSEREDTELFSNPFERKFDRVVSPFQDFVNDSTTTSVLLLICTVLALIIVHTPWNDSYQTLLQYPLGVVLDDWSFQKSLHEWINEGLMALFFFMIGLEIKRELLGGELQNIRLAIPVIAASIGGMLVPALIYTAFNAGSSTSHGWGITLATDTAFAVGVLALLGRRVQSALAAFLLALAIIDDIGAVLVIAIFYTDTIIETHLILAVALLTGLMMLNLLGVRRPLPYLLGGFMVWLAMLESGVHATVAGILVALTVPARPRHGPYWFMRHARRLINRFEQLERQKQRQTSNNDNILAAEDQHAIVERVQDTAQKATTPLQLWERSLENPVTLLILPIFAIANAGVAIGPSTFSSLPGDPVTLGIILGLVAGKAIGITTFCWLALKSGFGDLPPTINLKHVMGIALLGGMGFTMSIFIAGLSFGNMPEQLQTAKSAILLASLIAGLCGYLWLRITSSEDVK